MDRAAVSYLKLSSPPQPSRIGNRGPALTRRCSWHLQGRLHLQRNEDYLAKKILRPRPSARREWEQPALFLCRGSVLLHIRFGTPGHFIGGNILDVRRDVPLVAEWIDDRAGAVAVELVLDRTRLFRAGRNRLLEDGVHIVDVERNSEGGAAKSLRAFGAHLRAFVR